MKYTSSASSASSTLSSSSSVLPQIVVIEKFFGKCGIMMEIPKANSKWSSCEGGFQVGKNISWTPSIVARYISRHRGSSPSSPQKAPHHPQAERLLWVELWKWSQFLAFERSTALESRTPGSGPEAWGLGLSPPCGRDTENNHKSSSHLSEQVGMLRWQYIVDQ